MKSCIILAQIKSVDTSLFYLCCKNCLSKVNKFKSVYICKICNQEILNPSPHYKLSLEIFDGYALCRVTLFGKIINKFIGTNAQQFLRWTKRCKLEYNINDQHFTEILNQNLKKYFVGEWFYFKFNLKNIHHLLFNMCNPKDNKSSINVMNLKTLLSIHQEFKPLNVVNLYKTAKLGNFTTIIQKTNIILKKRKLRKLQSFYKNSFNVIKNNSKLHSYYEMKENKRSNIHNSFSVQYSLKRKLTKCANKQKLPIILKSESLNISINNHVNLQANNKFTGLTMNLFEQQSFHDNYHASINISESENKSNITNSKGSNGLNLNFVETITLHNLHNELTLILDKLPKNISRIDCLNNKSKRPNDETLKNDITLIDGSILNQSEDLFSPNQYLNKRKSFVASTPIILFNKLNSFTDDNRMQSPIIATKSICSALCIDSYKILPSNISTENNVFVINGIYNKSDKDQYILLSPKIFSNKKCFSHFENNRNNLIRHPTSINSSMLFENESKSIFYSNYNQSDDLFD